jgi:hypothetical protein
MSRTPILLLALAALVLGACAPATLGSRGTPVDLGRDRSATVTAGSTVYALARFPSGSFGLEANPFSERMAVPIGGGSGIRVGSAFELVDVIAPEGWSWRVEDAWVLSQSGRAATIEVTLRLDVPRTARLGGQQLRASIRALSTGGTEPVTFVVQVVDRR